MSAFKKAQKAKRKPHRERSQPSGRQHLGILEKKKDYKQRAKNFHEKEKLLKNLHKKALEKNPDEFYFKMVNKKLNDGKLWIDFERPEQVMTEEQRKLMQTQDLSYVNMRLQMEKKKLEKLSQVVDLDEKPMNRRIIFVDSKAEAKSVKIPDVFKPKIDEKTLEEIQKEKVKLKEKIGKRKKRAMELSVVADKMILQKQLSDSSVKRVREKKETKTSAAVYKWQRVRKR